MVFHIIQNKLGLFDINAPLLPLVARVTQEEDIPHPITYHAIMVLILIEFDVNCRLYFNRNIIKFNTA